MYLLGNAFLMMEKKMSDLSRTVEAGLIYTDRVIRDRCADSVSTYVNSMKQLADALEVCEEADVNGLPLQDGLKESLKAEKALLTRQETEEDRVILMCTYMTFLYYANRGEKSHSNRYMKTRGVLFDVIHAFYGTDADAEE